MKAPISLWILISSYILFLILYCIMYNTSPFYLLYLLAIFAFLGLIALVLGLPIELILKGLPTLNKLRTVNLIYYLTLLTILGYIVAFGCYFVTHFSNKSFFLLLGMAAHVFGYLGPLIIAATICFTPVEYTLIKTNKFKPLQPFLKKKKKKISLYILVILVIILSGLSYWQFLTPGTPIID